MNDSIAILSWSCRFPDAVTPGDLWKNVLEGRRSFRPLPKERLDLDAYRPEHVGDADSVTAIRAGLLTDWTFDRRRFRIPTAAFDSVDPAHWLALEVASEALRAAGGPDAIGRDRTGVFVANTLTGEHTRSYGVRLRLPFLDDVLAEAVDETLGDDPQAMAVRRAFAERLRARFVTPSEETLAGGLANTIAGRIANYFDLHGGAFLSDAACASSLVALSQAASALASGELDAAVVGSVDLSLDPFELVGFSRNGALARDEMLVFDRDSNGFWPGEGAGAAVLMRAEEARARGLRWNMTLRGWGISTDGRGGLTRPTVEGQYRALCRASERGAVDPRDVPYVEAHGTGTSVGDPVEVRALSQWRGASPEPLRIGSIKANIGHTKASAGFAGLIKAIESLRAGVLPPHVGCRRPHEVFDEVGNVRPNLDASRSPEHLPRLAGVSAFGFGGMNAHLIIEHQSARRRTRRDAPPAPLLPLPTAKRAGPAVYLFAAASSRELIRQLDDVDAALDWMSLSEVRDTSMMLSRECGFEAYRAALIASSGPELRSRLREAREQLAGGGRAAVSTGVFTGVAKPAVRVGFLFTGQGVPLPRGRSWCDRIAASDAEQRSGPVDPRDARAVQPLIGHLSLTAAGLLTTCGVNAIASVGHSLGELTALSWAGAYDSHMLRALLECRAAAMEATTDAPGAMLRVAANSDRVRALIEGLPLVIACHNGPADLVLSGPEQAVHAARARAESQGVDASVLAVSHGFHSPLMERAASVFADATRSYAFAPAGACVISTVTARPLAGPLDLHRHLRDQIRQPVLFDQALDALIDRTDLLIEVGPGSTLSELARAKGAAAFATRADSESTGAVMAALAAAFVAGVDVRLAEELFDGPVRPIDIQRRPIFITNPCGGRYARAVTVPEPSAAPRENVPDSVGSADVAQSVLTAVAAAGGLDVCDIRLEHRLLDDFHFNSLAVHRLVTSVAKAHGLEPPHVPTDLANATLRELIETLAAQPEASRRAAGHIMGVRPWVRSYRVDWAPAEPGHRADPPVMWRVVGIGAPPPEAGPPRDEHNGVLVWIPDDANEDVSVALLRVCQEAWGDARIEHLAIAHAGAAVSGFARSIAAESRFATVRVIERLRGASSLRDILDECARPGVAFDEVRLGEDGSRETPVFVPGAPQPAAPPLTFADVVLVSGGGGGIGAECALRLASKTGAAIALLGRTDPGGAGVTKTLDRARAMGLRAGYWQGDVSDHVRMRQIAEEIASRFGAVTAIVHAAGVNVPKAFPLIDPDDLLTSLRVKTTGLRALVDAAGPQCRRVITFGSIIGRLGLLGEAHYALANAWQTQILMELAATRPELSGLAMEWSVWAGVGMGERIGTIDRLANQGVSSLEIDDALDAFERFALGGVEGAHVITSRFGPPPFASLGEMRLPSLRFLERPLVHYPRVELVVETEINQGRDPYLPDHRVGDFAVVPAVMLLEAMSQAACAVSGARALSLISNVEFSRAVVVPDTSTLRLRIGTLVEGDSVEAVVRTDDDGFASVLARATFHVHPGAAPAPLDLPPVSRTLEAAERLYGPLFFHGPQFRMVRRLNALSTRVVVAEFESSSRRQWFGAYEPSRLLLGDPGARDAMLHVLQAAVPHKRVVPVSAGRIHLFGDGPVVAVRALETSAIGDTFVFEIEGCAADGSVVERWESATFKAIEDLDSTAILAAVPELTDLLVERLARSHAHNSMQLAVLSVSAPRDEQRKFVLGALGIDGHVTHRVDGRPLVVNGSGAVSFSYRDRVALGVVSAVPVGCDIESLAAFDPRSEESDFRHLEALERPLLRDGRAPGISRARAWTAFEALKKLGRRPEPGWAISDRGHGTIVLESDHHRVVTIGPLAMDDAGYVIAFAGTR